jgi:hypothetical protein
MTRIQFQKESGRGISKTKVADSRKGGVFREQKGSQMRLEKKAGARSNRVWIPSLAGL